MLSNALNQLVRALPRGRDQSPPTQASEETEDLTVLSAQVEALKTNLTALEEGHEDFVARIEAFKVSHEATEAEHTLSAGQALLDEYMARHPPFRFMDLPAELRNAVYDLSLVPDHPLDLWPMNSLPIEIFTMHPKPFAFSRQNVLRIDL